MTQADVKRNTLYYQHTDKPQKKKRETTKEYSFSDVFDTPASNKEIYNKIVRDLVATAVVGLSASFFVYGQTGSGKTYTISGTKSEEGVFQLAVKDILDRQKASRFKVLISTFEIYKEQIYDLLAGDSTYRNPLKIKEKKEESRFEVENLSSQPMTSWDDFTNIISKAESRRRFANTYLKHQSSRSHFGIQVKIVISEHRHGMLTFFDLAGCEKLMAYRDSMDMNFGDESSPLRVSQ